MNLIGQGTGDCSHPSYKVGVIKGSISLVGVNIPTNVTDLMGKIRITAFDSDSDADDKMCSTTLRQVKSTAKEYRGTFYLKYNRRTEQWDKKKFNSNSFRPDIYILAEAYNGKRWVPFWRSKVYENHIMANPLTINKAMPMPADVSIRTTIDPSNAIPNRNSVITYVNPGERLNAIVEITGEARGGISYSPSAGHFNLFYRYNGHKIYLAKNERYSTAKKYKLNTISTPNGDVDLYRYEYVYKRTYSFRAPRDLAANGQVYVYTEIVPYNVKDFEPIDFRSNFRSQRLVITRLSKDLRNGKISVSSNHGCVNFVGTEPFQLSYYLESYGRAPVRNAKLEVYISPVGQNAFSLITAKVLPPMYQGSHGLYEPNRTKKIAVPHGFGINTSFEVLVKIDGQIIGRKVLKVLSTSDLKKHCDWPEG